MVEVVGEFFAQGDVGTDAAVEKILGVRREQRLKRAGQGLRVGEDLGADLQMNTDAPGQSLLGHGDQDQGQTTYEKSHGLPLTV